MFCKKCGNRLKDDAKFCPKCGERTGIENSDIQSNNVQNNMSDASKKKGAKAVLIPIAIVFGILIIIIWFASCGKDPSGQTRGTRTQETALASEEQLVQLDIPVVTDWIRNGKYFELYLSEVPDAIGYEVMLGDQDPVSVSSNGIEVFVEEGETIEIWIRAVGDPEKTKPSEWNSCTLESSLIDYQTVDEFDEALLSFDQMKKWADAKGYECVVSEDEETTTLIMHYTDNANTGFMNGAERMVSGLFDGAFGKAEDELTARALLPSAVEKYISNGNLKDAVKEQAKDTTGAIGWGALEKGFEYIFMDTDVYRVYIYDKSDLNKSASLGMISYLKTNHHNPETSYSEKYDKFELDGEELYYHFSEMFNRNIDIAIGEDETYGWCPRWVIYLIPESL